MAHNKNKIPRLVVSKGAFSRFLEKNFFQALKRADIVYRDVALKNMICYEGRVILIDCQLATKRTDTEQVSFFDNILKLCMWKWESEPGMLVLEWSDVMTLMRALRSIGADVSYKERKEAMKLELHTFKYVHLYPSQKELNHCMKVCKLRSMFHPKAKLRARYRHVLEMLRIF